VTLRASSGRRRAEKTTRRRFGSTWLVAYYLSLAPVLVTQGINISYTIIEYRWQRDGLRPQDLESIVDPSPGWPPFQVPGLVFVLLSAPIAAMAVEMLARRSRTPSGAQPGFMAFVWAMNAFLCVAHSSAFDVGVFWTEPAGISGLIMLVSAAVAFALYVVRRVHRLLARRRGDPPVDEPADSLDPVRARLLRGTGAGR
jgi:hypothetical protein